MVRPAAPALVLALALALALACSVEQPQPDAAASPEPMAILIDDALLRDVLGEAVEVTADRVTADGLLVRLAFEPLIRQTGPVQLQLVQSQGYRLLGVAEGSPLWQLGLREGDVLTTVDREPILGREHELRSRWEGRPPAAEIGYLRDGQPRTLSLRIRSGSAWRGAMPQPEVVVAPSPIDPFAHADPLPSAASEPGIRCSPGTPPSVIANCEVERALFEQVHGDPGSFAKQVRIVPRTKDGVMSGVKLYGIRPSSLVSQLGLQNGDVLLAVDGEPLTSLDSAMAVYTRLPEQGSLPLTIERRGSTSTLMITIVEKLE